MHTCTHTHSHIHICTHAHTYTQTHVKTYTHIQVLYCCIVVGLLDYSHDCWFYWTHRMLHWGPLYQHIHYIHHKCVAVYRTCVYMR